MAVQDKEAASLAELVDQVLQVQAETDGNPALWFRGVSCSSYELLPGLLRDGKTAEQVFNREARLMARFRQRSMAYWPAGYPQNDWEHLFAMQHFGIPTRLLDWSENALFAAYFSLADGANHAVHDGACLPAVWCVDPVAWNRSVPPLKEYGDEIHVLTTADEELETYAPDWNRKRNSTPVALYGAHNSERILAQRGNFFVWGKLPKPQEEFAKDMSEEPLLWKIVLTGDPAQMRNDIRSLGFTTTMLFPDLPSLGIELTNAVEWKDEAS